MFSFLFLLVMTAVTFVLSEVLRPKPNIQNARMAHLGDFQFPTATQGRVVPIVWGTVQLSGPNVVWYGKLKPKAETVKVKTGMFSSKKQITGYKYYVGMQMALCRGQIDALTKIWIGNKEAWKGSVQDGALAIDEPKLFGGAISGQGGVVGVLNVYSGNATQIADPFLTNTPQNYLWFDDFSQGNALQGLHRFENSTPGLYYWVSDVGTGGTADLGPGATLISDSSPIATGTGTVGGTPTHIFNTENNIPTPPGDQHVYTAVLQHPDRVRLLDKIKVFLTFFAPSFSTDGGANPTSNVFLGMGCRVQDLPPFTNTYGIFLTVHNDNQLNVYLSTPTTGGATLIKALTSPGDFSTMSAATHTAELHVEGTKLTVVLNGATIWTGSDVRILELPGDNQGFNIIYSGNANTNYNNPAVDFSNVGIYNFGIDQIGRPITSDIPAYRGFCHTVWQGGYLGTATQIQPWAFEVRRCPNGLALTGNQHLVNDVDANPMNVLYEILTDPDWGLGFQSSDIDLTNFAANATTLFNEGNGFSGVLDTTKQATDVLTTVLQQIDGLMFIDRATGLWKTKLSRFDYVLGSCPVLNETNLLEIKNYSRGAWAETTNNVRVAIVNRDNEYQADYGIAQDMANIRIQNGAIVTTEEQYTGVKNKTLANQIAWRDLRMLAYPIAKAQVTTDRTLAGVNQGDVIAWSDTKLGIVNMAMRVSRVDVGKLEEGIVTLDLVQDVFSFQAPSYADPQQTSWQLPTAPQDELPQDTASGDRFIMEAPNALCRIAEESPGVIHRIWAGARDPADASNRFEIWASDSGAAYADSGGVEQFLVAAQLHAGIDASGAQGSSSIVVDTTPDAAADILLLVQNASTIDIGTKLFNIAAIDNEFIAFQTITDSGGGTLTLGGVYRGVMDTVPAKHLINTRVWFLCAGGNLTTSTFTPLDTVEVKLLTEGVGGILDIGIAQPTSVKMNWRALRPYPPVNMTVNGTLYGTTASIDSGLTIGFTRRDWRNTNEVNAIVSEAKLPFDFPDANNTVYRLVIHNDPAGLDTLVYTSPWQTASNTITVSRAKLIRQVTENLYSGLPTLVKGYVFDSELFTGPGADFTTCWLGTSPQGSTQFPIQTQSLVLQQTDSGMLQVPEGLQTLLTAAYLTAVASPPSFRSIKASVRLAAGSGTTTPDADQKTFYIFDRMDLTRASDKVIAFDISYGFGAGGFNELGASLSLLSNSVSTVDYGTARVDNYGAVDTTPYVDIDIEVQVDDSTNTYNCYVNGELWISAVVTDLLTQHGVGFGVSGLDWSTSTPPLAWFPSTGFDEIFNQSGVFSFSLSDASSGTGHIVPGVTTLTYPSNLRVGVQTQHNYGRSVVFGSVENAGTTYQAEQDLTWDFAITSAISGYFKHGLLPNGVASPAYTSLATGVYTLVLDLPLSTGAVQVSLNGGVFTTVIAAGVASGTFAVTAGQTIAIKHTQTGLTLSESMVILQNPSAAGVAFGILTY